MLRFTLAALVTFALILSLPLAQANDRDSKQEQEATAKAELEKKFTASYVRQHVIPGTTSRDQVIALYGTYFQESVSSGGSSLIFDKSDIRDRTTTGVGRLARKFNAAKGLASLIPGVAGSEAAYQASRPVNMASGAAHNVENLRDASDPYGSMDRIVFDFDPRGIVQEFQLF